MGSMYPPTYQPEIVPLAAEPQRGLDVFDVLFIFARRKWLLLIFALVGALSLFCWSLAQKKLYRADAVMMPPQEQQSSSALLGQLSALGALSGLGGGGAKSPSDLYIGLLQSRTVAERIVKDFDLTKAYKINSVPGAAGLLASRTKLVGDKDGLITVTVSDESPTRARDLANAYSNGLHDLNTTLAIGQASQRRLFFDQQLAEEKDKLADAEVALKEVEEKTGVIQLQGQTSVTISRISQLQADITSREVQLSALRASSTDENPDVIRTESELAGLRKQLVAMRGKAGVQGNDDLGIPSSQVPGLSLEYIRKERDVQYHTTLYELLAKQLEAARIDEAKAAPVVQVVDPAEKPVLPYFPKTILFTILGGVGGFILGCVRCVVLYVYDYIDEDPRLHMKMWAVKSALRGQHP
jgi:tyrosine-protein kinase Etk/Wzc